jgi:Protein of unknown function (DUF3987)/Bifunctional DNA primase/polymerase, N-terminal
MTPLEAARDLIHRGFNPVPVDFRDKKPTLGAGWQYVVITEANVDQYFNGKSTNIGVQLGAASRGLCDVDLDCVEGIKIAPYILPRTGAIFGRATARNSHYLYITQLEASVDTATINFDDPLAIREKRRDGRLVELRIGGHGRAAQTVVPPSIHKDTGESIRWEVNGDPLVIDGEELRGCVTKVAAYSLLARFWPETGSGCHEAAKIVGGFLSRLGLTALMIRTHVEAITKASASAARWKELARTAEDAAEAHATGRHAFGLTALRETFGPEIANRIAEWLGYQGDPGDSSAQQQHQQQNKQQHQQREPIFTWDDPDVSVLEDRRGELPDFPLHCLSEGWQRWACETAHGTGTTPAHVMMPLIAISSGLIGVARKVEASRSWRQPMALWTAMVGASGSGKSPGISATTRALTQIDGIRKPKFDEAKRAHEERQDVAKSVLKAWKKALDEANKKGEERPRKPKDAIVPGPFIMPRLWVSDVTIERAAQLLQARPAGLVYIADELAGLFANMSRYTDGEDRAFWLQAWNGDAFRQERVGRPPVSIDYLTVSIVGGFQPDKLAAAFGTDMDGLYARMLFAWPDEPPYRELTDEVAEVEPAIVNALVRIVRLGDADEDGTFAPRAIPLQDLARDVLEKLRKRVADGKGDLDGRERDWWSKVPAHVVRLAGTLQMLDWALVPDLEVELARGEPDEIDAQHMAAAVRLVMDYFWPHARAALRQIDQAKHHTDALRVLRWIRRFGAQVVTREEVRARALSRALNADETHELLMQLVRAGWLRVVVPQPGPQGGRPAIRWEVNPKLKDARL